MIQNFSIIAYAVRFFFASNSKSGSQEAKKSNIFDRHQGGSCLPIFINCNNALIYFGSDTLDLKANIRGCQLDNLRIPEQAQFFEVDVPIDRNF